MSDDYLVARLHAIVYRSLPPFSPRGTVEPSAALDELGQWLDDDRQWAAARRAGNWVSLLCDVERSIAELPATVRTAIEPTAGPATAALSQAIATLRDDARAAKAPGSNLRADLRRVQADLRSGLGHRDVLAAAWTDLRRAVADSRVDREHRALSLLASLAEMQGLSWHSLSRRLWAILGDDPTAIDELQAELTGNHARPPTRPDRPAGVPAAERLALAGRAVALAPETADRVVWMTFSEAVVERGEVGVGPWTTVYDGHLIVARLADAASRVPAELSTARDHCAARWGQVDAVGRPFALVRVALGPGSVADAVHEAERTTEVLLALAAFYNNGHVSWTDTGARVLFTDGVLRWGSVGHRAPPVVSGAELALARDRTAQTLIELAPTVGAHLPVRDPRVETALELLRWTVEARSTWAPAKLLLCDRVLERVAAWAGERDPDHLARRWLAVPWARAEALGDLVNAVLVGVHDLRPSQMAAPDPVRSALHAQAVDEYGIVEHEFFGSESVHVGRALEHLFWLRSHQTPGGDGQAELAGPARRLATPTAAARTLRRLEVDFDRLLNRARRTRNAIAHGGPIPNATVRAGARFFEQIASDALNQSLEALMTGRDVRAHLQARQDRHRLSLEALDRGVAPAEALAW